MKTEFVLPNHQHRELIEFFNRVSSVHVGEADADEVDSAYTDKVLNKLRSEYLQTQRVNEIVKSMRSHQTNDENFSSFAKRLHEELVIPQLVVDRSKYFHKRYVAVFPHTLVASCVIPTLLGFLVGYFLNGLVISVVTTFLVITSFRRSKNDVLESQEKIDELESRLFPKALDFQYEYAHHFCEQFDTVVQSS